MELVIPSIAGIFQPLIIKGSWLPFEQLFLNTVIIAHHIVSCRYTDTWLFTVEAMVWVNNKQQLLAQSLASLVHTGKDNKRS